MPKAGAARKPVAKTPSKPAPGARAKRATRTPSIPLATKTKAGADSVPKGQVAVRTPESPGSSNFVDAEKYGWMKDIILESVPRRAPGLTQGDLFDAVHAKASKAKFPGATGRWWAKCVHLDLEAKGVLRRVDGTPPRWYRA